MINLKASDLLEISTRREAEIKRAIACAEEAILTKAVDECEHSIRERMEKEANDGRYAVIYCATIMKHSPKLVESFKEIVAALFEPNGFIVRFSEAVFHDNHCKLTVTVSWAK